MTNLIEKLKEAKEYITSKAGDFKADLCIVLGSGLGGLADEVSDAVIIPYKDIPNFPVSTAPGHKSRLVIGKFEGKNVICMQGRFHFYEGYGMDEIVFPIQLMHFLGCDNLLLTNAAGCVNKDWKPGDLMIISDHIKLCSESPARGPNNPELGARFFDMGNTYNKALRVLAKKCASELKFEVREGVYMYFPGPQYETPAEVRFARIAGADAVGMSTVPEAIAASQMKMKTLGISCLTNMAAGILEQPLDENEVIETAQKVTRTFTEFVRKIIQEW